MTRPRLHRRRKSAALICVASDWPIRAAAGESERCPHCGAPVHCRPSPRLAGQVVIPRHYGVPSIVEASA